MNIISIETASDWCGIAFVKDGICFYKEEHQIPREHAEKLPIFYESLKVKTDLDKINFTYRSENSRKLSRSCNE